MADTRQRQADPSVAPERGGPPPLTLMLNWTRRLN